ncbi:MAG: T9SS type A sorting domain-containing protein [Melioribacteraceae bacterium]|nr:T9SS type A sorting domain-containing protein [Melioribacteraceae bacterium]
MITLRPGTNYTWGYGKLNIFRAMVSATNSLSVTNELLETQDWTTGYNNVGTNDNWLSEKFTPTISGKVTDVLFYPGTSISLTGDIPIEIWTDNSGSPNAITGSTVSFDQNALLPFSWNKLYFSSGNVSVTAGTPYHVVLKIPSGSTNRIVTDNSGTATGSKYSANSGSTWSSYSNDFGIRAVVTPLESAVPVELVSFSGKIINNSVILNWSTATEVNNYGFDVESKRTSTDKWTTIGFINGHGNSNSPKNYSYVDNSAEGGLVKYRLKQIDTDGSFEYSDEIEISFNKAYKYSLEQNHPNPFNPTTMLNYTIKSDSKVVIEIYNSLGQKVVELFSGTQSTGTHSVSWNATGYSSGTYFARFNATSLSNHETFSEIKKLLLLK